MAGKRNILKITSRLSGWQAKVSRAIQISQYSDHHEHALEIASKLQWEKKTAEQFSRALQAHKETVLSEAAALLEKRGVTLGKGDYQGFLNHVKRLDKTNNSHYFHTIFACHALEHGLEQAGQKASDSRRLAA